MHLLDAPDDSRRLPGFLLANTRTDSTFEQIPVIDFANATHPNPVVRRELANEIRDASINVGFFYIKNHGISEHIISSGLDAAKQFFDLAENLKQELDIHKSTNFKGYTPLLSENTDPNNRGDLHEAFDMGWEPEEVSLSGLRDDGVMTGHNVWPAGLPGFRSSVLAYYRNNASTTLSPPTCEASRQDPWNRCTYGL